MLPPSLAAGLVFAVIGEVDVAYFVLSEPLVSFGEEFFGQALATEIVFDVHVVEMADFADLENRRAGAEIGQGVADDFVLRLSH